MIEAVFGKSENFAFTCDWHFRNGSGYRYGPMTSIPGRNFSHSLLKFALSFKAVKHPRSLDKHSSGQPSRGKTGYKAVEKRRPFPQ